MAALNSSSAVASLSRLSPLSTATERRGMLTLLRMAVAAAASGGATIAPSASAAKSGSPAIATPSQATAPALSSTATTASANKGRQSRRTAPHRKVERRIDQGRGDEQREGHVRIERDRRRAGDERQRDARRRQHGRVGDGEPARHLQQQDRDRQQDEQAFEEAHAIILLCSSQA